MSVSNFVQNPIDFDFVELRFASVLRLPLLRRLAESEEPNPACGWARRSQNQFTPLGDGV